jgi:hypothetical protein
MKSRCYNDKHKRFKYYGAKGIDVCIEWHEYEPFRDYILTLPNCPIDVEVVGSHLERSIDRIHNDKGYKPGNIRWATSTEQMNNTSTNRIFTINGTRMSFADAVRLYGKAPYKVIRYRLERGWHIREAFRTPARGRRARYA